VLGRFVVSGCKDLAPKVTIVNFCMKNFGMVSTFSNSCLVMKSWTAPSATTVIGKPVDEVPVVGSQYSFPSLPISTPPVSSIYVEEQKTSIEPTAPLTKKGKKKSKKGIPLDIWGTGSSPPRAHTTSPSQYASAVKKAPVPGTQASIVDSKSPPKHRVERPIKVDIPWLETGSAASSVYTEYRSEAVSLAHMRFIHVTLIN
jgi:hypothetical protein